MFSGYEPTEKGHCAPSSYVSTEGGYQKEHQLYYKTHITGQTSSSSKAEKWTLSNLMATTVLTWSVGIALFFTIIHGSDSFSQIS